MKNLMLSMLAVLQLTFVPVTSEAKLLTYATVAQLENDARIFLKQVHSIQESFRAEHERYMTQQELNLALPFYLKSYFNFSVTASSLAYTAKLVGILAPVKGRNISVSNSGKLSGITQYASAAELVAELMNILRAIDTAERAYYAEWESYTTDFNLMGLVIPAYLTELGRFEVTYTSSGGYTRQFVGTVYPVANVVLQ